jgi:hypothetical protein
MITLLFSCPHATCVIPGAHREMFKGAEEIVQSPEGWDPGALNLAQSLSMRFHVPLEYAGATRLLVDPDADGDGRWSRYAEGLGDASRERIFERHVAPYRDRLSQRAAGSLARGSKVLHISVHTLVSADGMVLLETPAGAVGAADIAGKWCSLMRHHDIQVRHEASAAPGAVHARLMNDHGRDAYLPLRLVVSQVFFLEGRPWKWDSLKRRVIDTLQTLLDEGPRVSGQEDLSSH